LNKFGEGNRCQNFLTCNFDIETAPDLEGDDLKLEEITEHTFLLRITDWNLDQKVESKIETVWFC
jgi:hypothetical protein